MAAERKTVITIAGDLGSGKSTVAALVAAGLDARSLSTGDIQRALAASLGLTTLELNEYAETHPEIDERIDNETRKLAFSTFPFVFDSRMAWHFIPDSFKVCLLAEASVAADRVLQAQSSRREERYGSFDEARSALLRRRKSETTRFLTLYGVDCSNPRNYDLVIDTSNIGADAAASLLVSSFRAWHVDSDHIRLWLNPRALYPTEGIRALCSPAAEEVAQSIAMRGFLQSEAIEVIWSSGSYLILDGHKRTAGALKAGCDLIPARLVAAGSEEVIRGLTARQYAADSCTKSRIYDWEDGHGFRFALYPEFEPLGSAKSD